MADSIQQAFEENGVLIRVEGNKPLLLNDDRYVWMLKSGFVDIFSVRLEDNEPVGALTFMFRQMPETLIFGFGTVNSGSHSLVARGTTDTSLYQVTIEKFKEMAEDVMILLELHEMIDQWIDSIWERLRSGLPPRNSINLETFGELSFDKGKDYRSEKGIGWIKHNEGKSLLNSREDVEIDFPDAYFPVSDAMWLSAAEKVSIEHYHTLKIIQLDALWSSLERFHSVVQYLIEDLLRIQKQSDKIKVIKRAENDQQTMSTAMTNLAMVLTRESDALLQSTSDPLLAALRMVGRKQGITFEAMPEMQRKREIKTDPLEDIVRASRVRYRKVVLGERFWEKDCGPLLAYKDEGATPVALLPSSTRSYDIVDPADNSRRPVNESIAEELEHFAYSFYSPLPERKLDWKDLIKLGFRGNGRDIAMVFFMGIIAALLGLLTPVITRVFFDDVIPEVAVNQLYQMGFVLLMATIAIAIFELTKSFALLRIEGKSDSSLQAAVWDRLLKLPIPFFRRFLAGDLAERSMGINAIRNILSGVTISSVLSCIFSLVFFLLMLRYDKSLSKLAAIIGFVSIVITMVLGLFSIRFLKPLQEIQGRISGLVYQLITGVKKLRITGTENYALEMWSKDYAEQKRLAYWAGVVENVVETITAVLPVFASMILFFKVTATITDPEKTGLTTGKFLGFMSAYGSFQGALIEMSMAIITSMHIFPIYQRLKPILETEPEVDPSKSKPDQITGNIEVNHVNFRYKADGPLVLRDVSMTVRSGDFVAIVGGSGSGKSTLIRLLLGFEEAETGGIYYDGQDLGKFDVTEIRRQIGVVLQNSLIMSGSIFENIVGSGTSGLTIDDAWEAARMAGCYDDIQEMPMKMHTILPPGGGTLSGGQRQRIIIARAIVKKPRLLIFDEATSALDNRTQAMVSESIERLQSTRIVIAHRISTIINADIIYVLDKGEIVQTGTYNELIGQKGLFADLAKRQVL